MNKLMCLVLGFLAALMRGQITALAVYDSGLLLRAASAANLTATVTTAGLDLGSAGGWLHSQADLRISVPQATGTLPTLDAKIQESDDNSTYYDLLTFAPTITAAGNYRRKIQTVRRYVRAVLTVGGTLPNFGAVVVGIDSGGEQKEYSR